jgi:hypothetical protein
MPADNLFRRNAMTFATIAALFVSLGNAALVALLWDKRLRRGRERPASFRSNIALSALLAITFSSVTYVVFVLLGLYTRAAFNGRQPIVLFAMQGGLATAAMALLGGCFGHSWERAGILGAAVVSGVLWLMAAAANALVL